MKFLRKIIRNKTKEMYKKEKPINLKNEKMPFNEYYKEKSVQNEIKGIMTGEH